MTQIVIQTQALEKTFYSGFFGNLPALRTLQIGGLQKRVHAVKGINLQVHAGEVFAFLGPNGAGKSTTLKMLTGLIKPTQGEGFLLGHPLGDPKSRQGLGYLPENPVFYEELTPLELMVLSGATLGLNKRESRQQGGILLERLSLSHALDRPLRKLSKGMHQRVGIAQALLNHPQLLILDEPFSGLDPIGRQEVRDVLLDYQKQGTALFFSSHILADVEALCDRFALIDQGLLVHQGRIDDLEAETTHIQSIIEVNAFLGEEMGDPSLGENQMNDLSHDQSQRESSFPSIHTVHSLLEKYTQAFMTQWESQTQFKSPPPELHFQAMGSSKSRFKVKLPLEAQSLFLDLLRTHSLSLVHLSRVRPSLEEIFIQRTRLSTPSPSITESTSST